MVCLAAASCTPEITDGSYFCGPNRGCPERQQCSNLTFTCVQPDTVRDFECPVDSELAEPDDSREQAVDVGDTQCGTFSVSERPGCLPSADDQDWLRGVPVTTSAS